MKCVICDKTAVYITGNSYCKKHFDMYKKITTAIQEKIKERAKEHAKKLKEQLKKQNAVFKYRTGKKK